MCPEFSTLHADGKPCKKTKKRIGAFRTPGEAEAAIAQHLQDSSHHYFTETKAKAVAAQAPLEELEWSSDDDGIGGAPPTDPASASPDPPAIAIGAAPRGSVLFRQNSGSVQEDANKRRRFLLHQASAVPERAETDARTAAEHISAIRESLAELG